MPDRLASYLITLGDDKKRNEPASGVKASSASAPVGAVVYDLSARALFIRR